jgi:TldD protein
MTQEDTHALDELLPRLGTLLDPDQIRVLLREARHKGAEFAEVYAEYRLTTSMTLEETHLKDLSLGVHSGVGVRAIHGSSTGYAYADSFAMADLLDAARTAAGVVQRGTVASAPVALRSGDVAVPSRVAAPPAAASSEEQRIDWCMRADQAARNVDGRVHTVRVLYGDVLRRILVANSEGTFEEDEQSRCRLALSVLAQDGSVRQTASRRYGGAVDRRFFAQTTPESMGRQAGEAAVRVLAARPAPSGSMPVLVGPGWGGVLVHECFGHSLEGDGVRKRTSIRADQLGRPVAAPCVTIYDDGTLPRSRGSFRIDDEAVPAQRTLLVEDGILRGFLWDRLNARLAGAEPTGNGRRDSYRHYPVPRMTNTYIAAGRHDPHDLVRAIDRGFYCADFGGGSVNPADGNFSFHVTEGYWIENGRLTAPVTNATLTGNGNDAMLLVEAVGNDLQFDKASGSCGKAGQRVPVGVGQPTLQFRRMTVGG